MCTHSFQNHSSIALLQNHRELLDHKACPCASWVATLMQPPKSAKKSRALVPMAQAVSTATATSNASRPSQGTSPSSSAHPSWQQCGKGACACGIPDQTLAIFQGMIITPPSLLPSNLQSPVFSSIHGICAAAKKRLTMLLMAAWQEWHPSFLYIAAEAMGGPFVHHSTTVAACVGLAQRNLQVEPHSYAFHFIVDTETKG